MALTREEVIERLCMLMGKVTIEVFQCREVADCVCLSRANMPDRYQNNGEAIKFIEDAVEAAIQLRNDNDTGSLR
jgi:hypothetical protein